jgi:ribosomal-protein-alanine N-acetyltransferase
MALAALFRPATEDDVTALLAVEAEAFSVLVWPADTFLRYECTVADIGGQIAGFLVSRQTFGGDETAPPEREILNLAVAPAYRRQGIATALMHLEFRKKATFVLEVRESNSAAQALYRQLGFAEISRRRDYYDHPRESAIVMQRK